MRKLLAWRCWITEIREIDFDPKKNKNKHENDFKTRTRTVTMKEEQKRFYLWKISILIQKSNSVSHDEKQDLDYEKSILIKGILISQLKTNAFGVLR